MPQFIFVFDLFFNWADPASSNQIKQSIPSSTIMNKPLIKSDFVKQDSNFNGECTVNNTDNSQDDVFLVEPIDADDEMSQNTVIGTVNANCDHSKTQLTERYGREETINASPHREGRLLQESPQKTAQGIKAISEMDSQRPTQCLCNIMFSSPMVHIPRKQKPKGEDCKALSSTSHIDTDDGNANKQVREFLALWKDFVLTNFFRFDIASCICLVWFFFMHSKKYKYLSILVVDCSDVLGKEDFFLVPYL